MHTRLHKSPPIASRLASPPVYLALTLVCQTALLAINLNLWSMLGESLSGTAARTAEIIAAAELALFIATVSAALAAWRWRGTITGPLALLLLVLPAAYLCLFCIMAPGSIDRGFRWITTDDRLLLYQFMFIMPLVIYAVIRLALFPWRASVLKTMGLSLTALALPPLLCFLAIAGAERLNRGIRSWSGTLLMVFMAVTIVVMLLAMARLMVLAGSLVRGRSIGRMRPLLYFIVGIVLPTGGLVLNSKIPFPADFQHPAFYCIAFLNGLALMIPETGRMIIDRTGALARSILFPYTFYFFIVFIPFVPFSVPALVVFGAGILLLAPTILFVVQGRRLLADLRHADGTAGARRWRALMVAGLFTLPLGLTALGLAERAGITGAVAYFYEADYSRDCRFQGNTRMARQALDRLSSAQRGQSLPLISDYYRWLVFNGMTLSDEKILYISQALAGRPQPAPGVGVARRSSSANDNTPWLRGASPDGAAPSRDVVIEQITAATSPEGDLARSHVTIAMRNTTGGQSEFRCDIDLPAGSFVTGYWLTVGTGRVPGRIFEKKAALWVYQSIVESLRDPGILHYDSANTVKLRVFPFAPGERRITEISFIHPRGLATPIHIGGRPVVTPALPAAPVVYAAHKGATASILLPASVTAALPLTRRTPYLHLIVDRSSRAAWSAGDIDAAIDRALALTPGISMIAITAANYEIADLTDGMRPRAALSRRAIEDALAGLPRRGAFCVDRAIAHALTNYRRRAADPTRGDILFYPVIVVLTGPEAPIMGTANLKALTPAVPECTGFRVDDGAYRHNRDLTGRPVSSLPKPPDVAVIQAGMSALAVVRGHDALVHLPAGRLPRQIAAYNAAHGGYDPAVPTVPVESGHPYAQALAADARCREMPLHPWRATALRNEAVVSARETGILNPASAYIVVESTAQWKALERAHRDRMANREPASLTKSPETPAWVLAGVLFLGLALIRVIKRRGTNRIHV